MDLRQLRDRAEALHIEARGGSLLEECARILKDLIYALEAEREAADSVWLEAEAVRKQANSPR